MRLRFAFIFSFFQTAIAFTAPSLAEDYFSVDSCKEIPPFYEKNGYAVSDDIVTWLIAPDGIQVRLLYAQSNSGKCNGIRLETWWFIKKGSAALEAAYYYESTNPLASITVEHTNEKILIELQRDIEIGPGRTEENILANTSLIFKLIPYFQNSLIQADPSLPEWWENNMESGK